LSSLPTLIGPYEIIRPLGKGGMGTVYLARDPDIDRLVAIKLLREGLDSPELRERFAREGRSAGGLRHPNIVTIFQVGQHESQPFIVMEYIPGDTLADIVKRKVPLTLSRKLRIIEDLCRGLAYAHKSGIVHRDVKPANILVDSDGVVKILDFGIARVGEQGLTRMGMMMGTPNYMSPEQINPGQADHRSDVFTVGLVFYELLTYRRAFPGESFAVLNNILHNEPEPVEDFCPGLDREVVAILQRALEKDPAARYQDLGVMRAELSRAAKRLRAGQDETADEGPITATTDASITADTPTLPSRPGVEIDAVVAMARQALAAGRFAEALEAAARALALDPRNGAAAELCMQAQRQIAIAEGRQLLASAQKHVEAASYTAALHAIQKIDALQLPADAAGDVLATVETLRQTATAGRERILAARRTIDTARDQLDAGNLEAARASVAEALRLVPGDADALGVQREIAAAEAEREQRERAAQTVIARARVQAARGEFDAAIKALRAHQPEHQGVHAALSQVLADRAAAEERRALEEQRQRDEEYRRRREAEERKRREAEELKRREAEERKRREAEESKRREAEERKRREAEELKRRETEDRKRREAEDLKRREAEDTKRREADDRKRREAEELKRKEADDRKRRDAELRAEREAEERQRRETAENATKVAAADLIRPPRRREIDATILLPRDVVPPLSPRAGGMPPTPIPGAAEPRADDPPSLLLRTGPTSEPGRPAPAGRPEPPAGESERKSPLVWVIPASAASLLLVLGVWYYGRDNGRAIDAGQSTIPATITTTIPLPATTTAPVRVTSVVTTVPKDPSPGIDTRAIHNQFTDAMNRNDLERALRVIVESPANTRGDATVAADLDRLLDTARSRATAAFAQAQTVPGARASADFRSAQEKRTGATTLERRGRKTEAVSEYIVAVDLFAKVIPSAVTTTIPAQVNPVTTVAPTTTIQVTTTVPSSIPSTVTTTVRPTGNQPDPALDKAAVTNVLVQYVTGYERRDVDAIRRVYPGAPSNLNLSDVRSYSLVLENPQTTIVGDIATVTATRRIRVQMSAGAAQQQSLRTVFTLRRAAGGWVIERIQ
jgi:hypothetical protein